MSAPAATLYTREILRLATALPHDDRLAAPQGSASCRAPICGSEVTAEVVCGADGAIKELAFRARACALGQASAALLREQAVGLDASAIAAARDALARYLDGEAIALPWDALGHFDAARSHSARHGAILLPYNALLAALEDAA
jgi:NifU-like protein involved in Fe-S cluster formation